jgi:hypothetical protein
MNGACTVLEVRNQSWKTRRFFLGFSVMVFSCFSLTVFSVTVVVVPSRAMQSEHP